MIGPICLWYYCFRKGCPRKRDRKNAQETIHLLGGFFYQVSVTAEFLLNSCSKFTLSAPFSCHFSFIGIPDFPLLTLSLTQFVEFSQPALFLKRVLPYSSQQHTERKMVLYSDTDFCFVILHVCNTAFFVGTHCEQWRAGGCGTMSVLD